LRSIYHPLLRRHLIRSFTLLGSSLLLSGCFVLPEQLQPPNHVVTTEPDGTVVKDECYLPVQIAFPSVRMDCVEDGERVTEDCDSDGCIYKRGDIVFRQCTHLSRGFFTMEKDCFENGVHIDRKCDRGWTTVTCKETIVK
jgi:hypothetical protein